MRGGYGIRSKMRQWPRDGRRPRRPIWLGECVLGQARGPAPTPFNGRINCRGNPLWLPRLSVALAVCVCSGAPIALIPRRHAALFPFWGRHRGLPLQVSMGSYSPGTPGQRKIKEITVRVSMGSYSPGTPGIPRVQIRRLWVSMGSYSPGTPGPLSEEVHMIYRFQWAPIRPELQVAPESK